MREHFNVRLYLRIVIRVLVLITVGVLRTTGVVAQVSPTRTSPQSAAVPKSNQTLQATATPKLPPCPPAGLPKLQASPQTTGHHKVTLSWNTGVPPGNSESKPVGYCLYRSKKQNAAKQNATCSNCEQINSIALADTACIDDLVEDGAKYYYVVTAIDAKEKISLSSNEALAQIPSGTKSTNSASQGSFPLCRATQGLK